MRRMIDAHHEDAKRTGARIVFSCGFDSIPFDLGVLTLQEKAREKFGRPARRVKARLRKVKGGMSGGTAASARATVAAAARDPSLIRLLTDPFALTPGFTGPSQPSGLIPEYDPSMNVLLVPFPMAPINTKNVHRTNFLLGHPYGTDFVYDEMMVAPGFGGNRSGDDGDVGYDGFLVPDRRSQARRRPDSGRAREGPLRHPVCTENLVRVDDMMESPKLAE
jgi:short subunit dehydrogenase-like uncharacterized protein